MSQGKARSDAIDWDDFLHQTSSTTLGEAAVEGVSLGSLGALGWAVAHGPDIAPDALAGEPADSGVVVLNDRWRLALARLNPDLPGDALDDALRRLT